MSYVHPLKSALTARNQSLSALARSLDPPVRSQYLSQIISGRFPATPRIRQQVSARLGLPEFELFPPDAITDAITDLVARTRKAQGLPASVQAADILERVAVVLRGGGRPNEAA